MKHLNLSAGSQHEINEACVFVSSNPTSWQVRISTTVNLSNSPAVQMQVRITIKKHSGHLNSFLGYF